MKRNENQLLFGLSIDEVLGNDSFARNLDAFNKENIESLS